MTSLPMSIFSFVLPEDHLPPRNPSEAPIDYLQGSTLLPSKAVPLFLLMSHLMLLSH